VGLKAYPILADLSDWDQVHRVVRESHDALGGLDIVINNPVMVVAGAFAKQAKEDIDQTVLGSLTMLMYGAHAALKYMFLTGLPAAARFVVADTPCRTSVRGGPNDSACSAVRSFVQHQYRSHDGSPHPLRVLSQHRRPVGPRRH
jgi:NAD(P)-dependent dehydrogenase (short-subunit alcohol dehydrogenase family)